MNVSFQSLAEPRPFKTADCCADCDEANNCVPKGSYVTLPISNWFPHGGCF